MKKVLLPILAICGITACSPSTKKQQDSEVKEVSIATDDLEGGWKSLFNGEDLAHWKVKISKHELEDNYANT